MTAPVQLPIPADATPDGSWTGQMRDFADIIGPHATLLLVDALGGQHLYVPHDAAKGRLTEIVGAPAATAFCREYAGMRLVIPTARAALARARRGPVLARVRSGELTIGRAAAMLAISRNYASQLLNTTDEGRDAAAPSPARTTRQMDLFGEG